MCERRAGAPSRFVDIEKRVFDKRHGLIALVLVDGGRRTRNTWELDAWRGCLRRARRTMVGCRRSGVGENSTPGGRLGRDVQRVDARCRARCAAVLHTDQLWVPQQRTETQRDLLIQHAPRRPRRAVLRVVAGERSATDGGNGARTSSTT